MTSEEVKLPAPSTCLSFRNWLTQLVKLQAARLYAPWDEVALESDSEDGKENENEAQKEHRGGRRSASPSLAGNCVWGLIHMS